MGDNSSVEIANLFLSHYLDSTVNDKCAADLLYYGRYIDDGIAITHNPDLLISTVTTALNAIGLKLSSLESSKTQGNFLDLSIFIDTDRIATNLYQKPLNQFLYLPFSSFHPKHTLKGWIFGELTRYQRNCTYESDYLHHKFLFYNRLLLRCYPHRFLDPIFLRHQFTAPARVEKPAALPLLLPYSTRNVQPLRDVITKHRQLLVPYTGHELICSWTVPRNLGSHLISSSSSIMPAPAPLTSHKRSRPKPFDMDEALLDPFYF